LPSSKTFVAAASPSSKMKKSSPYSPSLTTYSSLLNFNYLIASATCILSYGSISARMSTFFKKSSYLSLFRTAASLTIWLKVPLSSEKQTAYVFALIVAALGAL